MPKEKEIRYQVILEDESGLEIMKSETDDFNEVAAIITNFAKIELKVGDTIRIDEVEY